MRKLVKGGLCVLALVCAFGLGRGEKAYTETDLARAREEAYNSGYHTGYEKGLSAEQDALYEEAFAAGRSEGYDTGLAEGYETGLTEGVAQGSAQTEDAMRSAAGDTYQQGYDTGYEEGYAQKEKDEQAAREQYLASLKPVSPTPAPTEDPTAPAEAPPLSESDVPVASETNAPAVPDNETAQVTVYITNSGSKYHLDGCRHLKSKIQKTLEEAKALGLEPCKVCNPPK